MAGQETRAGVVNTPLVHFAAAGDGFPLWTSDGTK